MTGMQDSNIHLKLYTFRVEFSGNSSWFSQHFEFETAVLWLLKFQCIINVSRQAVSLIVTSHIKAATKLHVW